MKTHAFIFARGGSKKLPKKNIKLLNGKPLIQYSIEVALQISKIDKIFVSTEDEVISKIARSLGVEVINRPLELSLDDTPEWKAWQHAINWVKNKYGNFEQFVSLPPTSPLRIANDVESAITKKNYLNADVCIAVTPSNRNPYFNMVKSSNNLIELVNKSEKSITRRQDAPKIFDVTTIVYVANVDFILNKNYLFDGKITSIEIPKNRAIDIDDIDDFNFAETVIKNNLIKNN
jgi:CMP-N-acetylneuraminic acid synthetase